MGGRPGRRPVGPRDRRQPGPPASAGPRGLGGREGGARRAARELLLANKRRVKDVWLAEDLEPAPILDDILELAAEARVAVKRVGRTQLEHAARSDAPQGVLAHAQPLQEVDLDRLA